MTALALRIADGSAFFAGLVLLLLSLAIKALCRRAWLISFSNIGSVTALALIAISGTPLPIAEYGLLGLFALSASSLAQGTSKSELSRRIKAASLLGTFCLCIGLGAQEWPFRSRPSFGVAPSTKVYVIGDSISAGMRRDPLLWPTALAQSTGLEVINLAQAGATVADAKVQIRQVPETPSAVILEIGGNDLLGTTSAEAFRKELEAILAPLSQSGHHLLMFELPLVPFKNGFGRAQRDLAKRYSATLIPKREFAMVLAAEGATEDGLHLSPKGHELFASMVSGVLDIRK
jgi:acyl-CoA thioesterase-1